MPESRVIVWFSCGAASACAAYLAVKKYGHSNVHVVYCDTSKDEHPDNGRFMRDVSIWIDHPIELISSDKYSSVDDVFEKERYMSGVNGARCTVEMKKVPRFKYQRPDDLHIFGLTADEDGRIEQFKHNNPELHMEWILKDSWITKISCYSMLGSAGIRLPVMYELGFNNNNCIGCVKATSPAYWVRVRQHFPEVFEKRARQSRELGVRLIRIDGQRVFLDQLPPVSQSMNLFADEDEDIECGPVCIGSKAL